jgi:hypothetical protein
MIVIQWSFNSHSIVKQSMTINDAKQMTMNDGEAK